MTGNQQRKRKGNRRFIVLAVIICLLGVSLAGALVARYVAGNERQAEMYASDFHVSSNYLREGNTGKYTVTDWGNHGIDILLYNYETENIALIAEADIEYQVTTDTTDDWKVTVKKQTGEAVTAGESGKYILAGDGINQNAHTIHVEYIGEDTPNKVQVTVKTIAPYVKELTAEFTLSGKKAPEYTIEDKGTYCLMTVQSNDFDGAMKVEWDSSLFSPDNTNVYMSTWSDTIPAGSTGTYPSGSFTVESYHTYELIFVKKTSEEFKASGSGTIISLVLKEAGE